MFSLSSYYFGTVEPSVTNSCTWDWHKFRVDTVSDRDDDSYNELENFKDNDVNTLSLLLRMKYPVDISTLFYYVKFLKRVTDHISSSSTTINHYHHHYHHHHYHQPSLLIRCMYFGSFSRYVTSRDHHNYLRSQVILSLKSSNVDYRLLTRKTFIYI